MRKIIIFVIMLLSSPLLMYSQARVNAELAVADDTGRELIYAIGWYLDNNGQWKSNRNYIPYTTYSNIHSLRSFVKIKLYNINYKNNEYLLFEIMGKGWDYEYPSIREGRYEYRKSYFYLIEKDKLIFRIAPNKKITNSIEVISSFDESQQWLKRFQETNIYSLPTLITRYLENPSFRKYSVLYAYPSIEWVVDKIELFTFYYKDENVIRFYFGDDNTREMPENYYFETSFEHFINFFNPIIEE